MTKALPDSRSIELIEGRPLEVDVAFERYLQGDLDRVERPRFEAHLEGSAALANAFATVYDEAVDEAGLLAFSNIDPATAECFSEESLFAWTQGLLRPDEHRLIEDHLRCPRCAAYIACLRGAAADQGSAPSRAPDLVSSAMGSGAWSEWLASLLPSARWPRAAVLATAVAAVVLGTATITRSDRQPRYRGEDHLGPLAIEIDLRTIDDSSPARAARTFAVGTQLEIRSRNRALEARFVGAVRVDARGRWAPFVPRMSSETTPTLVEVLAGADKRLRAPIPASTRWIVVLISPKPYNIAALPARLEAPGPEPSSAWTPIGRVYGRWVAVRPTP